MLQSPHRAGRARTADADVTPAAALLADPARVAMLFALLDGRSLTAGELARAARVRPSTASSHLGRLDTAGWIIAEATGRHRYYRLANGDIARVLEALALLTPKPAPAGGVSRPIGDELRLARTCYDHLAGRAGVAITGALVEAGVLQLEGRTYRFGPAAPARLLGLGIDPERVAEEAKATGRYVTRACMDWSERRFHLAGALGHALLLRVMELGWFERQRGTRALRLTNSGRRTLQREFGVRLV